jgi:hypothetical protein
MSRQQTTDRLRTKAFSRPDRTAIQRRGHVAGPAQVNARALFASRPLPPIIVGLIPQKAEQWLGVAATRDLPAFTMFAPLVALAG